MEMYNPCSSANACLNNGKCQVTENGMYTCRCLIGFFGDRCEYHQPCNPYTCKNNGTCVHSLEGDLCYCRPGFSGEYLIESEEIMLNFSFKIICFTIIKK